MNKRAKDWMLAIGSIFIGSALGLGLANVVIHLFPPVPAIPQTTINRQYEDAKNCSVIVSLPKYEAHGTGVLIHTPRKDFVLTAAHVVEDARKVVDGKVKFESVQVIKYNYVKDHQTCFTTVDADIVRYSAFQYGHDLALLQLRDTIAGSSVKIDNVFRPIGTDVFHIGTFGIIKLNTSFSKGIISGFDRRLNKNPEDYVIHQADLSVHSGGSGGGLFEVTTGNMIGTVVRKYKENICFYIPAKRIRSWADMNEVSFIYDNSNPIITNLSGPIEDCKVPLPEVVPPPTKLPFPIPFRLVPEVVPLPSTFAPIPLPSAYWPTKD